MELSKSENLMREYVKYFDRIIFLPLKYMGFGRFDIKNNRIVQRSYKTLLINVFIIVIANIGASILLSTAATQDLKFPELITIVHFVTFANLLLINSTFFNRKCGYDIMACCINIDVFLGVEETHFMRNVVMKNLAVSCVLVAILSIVLITYMYYIFTVSLKVHIVGSAYFIWLFCAYDDYFFFLSVLGFISLRVRYLNVAIMKLTAMNSDYVPDLLLFHILYWRKGFDKRITFHTRAGQKEYTQAFRMLFQLFDLSIQGYKFAMVLGVCTVVVGTFVSVQGFIIYIQSSRVDILRASAVTGWAVSAWIFTFLFCQLIDMLTQQIEQTVLICSYVQLKPTISPEIHKSTKAILRTIEVRNWRGSNYGMFNLDTGLVFRIAVSTFIYITVQLQMSFPALDQPEDTNNATLSTSACIFMPPYSCTDTI